MKNLIKILIITLLLIPELLVAQNYSLIQSKYEQAVRRLEFTKDVEVSFPNSEAHELLRNAEKYLNSAQSYISSTNYLLANRQIDNAILLINNALKILLNNPIRRQREKLNELFQYAENIVLNSGNKKAEQLLQEAQKNRNKAIGSYKNGRYQLALEHFRLAFYLVNKAIEIAENQGINIQEKIQQEKERLEQLYNKAKEAVENSQNQTAQRLFRHAEKQIRSTRKATNNRNYTQALEHYHKATRLLLRVIDIASGKEEKLAITAYDDVAALDELIDRIKDKVETGNIKNNKRISFLLDRTLEFQQKAHNALEEKQFETAQFNVRMARNLIERALQILNKNKGDRFARRTKDELDQLNVNLEEISSVVNESGNEEAILMLDLAYTAQKRAHVLFETGRQRLVLGAIAIASKLAFAAEQLVLNPVGSSENENIIQRNLERLEQSISDLKSRRQQLSTIDKLFLKEAEKCYSLALDAFDNGFLNVTEECIEIARRYLNKISK